jgi:hypothetical protein
VTGSGSTTLTLSAAASVPGGTYYVTITGTSGILSHTTTIAVFVGQPAPPITSFTVSPSSVESGDSIYLHICLSSPAPVGGAAVALTSSNPTALAPSTVSIPAGQNCGNAEVPSGNVSTSTSTTLTANYSSNAPMVSVDVKAPQPLSFDEFRVCISHNSKKGTCRLAPGPVYSVDQTLLIERSNITIEGLIVSGPSDVVLRRGQFDLAFIMQASLGYKPTGVTIRNLTFDGNRYGWGTGGYGISCENSPITPFTTDVATILATHRPYTANHTSKTDVDLRGGGIFTLKSLNFINSPDTALWLSGNGTYEEGDPTPGDPAILAVQPAHGSTISTSTFGFGGYGIGPGIVNDAHPPQTGQRFTEYQETGQETATRFTAIKIDGSYSGAYFNAIYNAGTAGITLTGKHQTLYSNQLFGNRYEISDGSGGGQIDLDRGFDAVVASDAVVVGNVVDGWNSFRDAENSKVENIWPVDAVYTPVGEGEPKVYSFRFDTSCLIVPPSQCFDSLPDSLVDCIRRQQNAGFEVHGFGHSFYNNESSRHSGSGMQVGGTWASGNIKISSANLWFTGDTMRLIEGNGGGGIVFLGAVQRHLSVQGALLDEILVRNNSIAGVFLDSVQGSELVDSPTRLTYQGFSEGACMKDNKDDWGLLDNSKAPPGDVVILQPPPPGHILRPTPSGAQPSNESNSADYPHKSYIVQPSPTSYRGSECPGKFNTVWTAPPTPPPSNIPGWPW